VNNLLQSKINWFVFQIIKLNSRFQVFRVVKIQVEVSGLRCRVVLW